MAAKFLHVACWISCLWTCWLLVICI